VAAGPVSRILSAGESGRTIIPLGRALLRGSSDLPEGCDAPSQHVFRAKPELPSYLVLLRVGFAVPATLLWRRCALTAPFHPYLADVLSPRLQKRVEHRTQNDGGAVCFLWHSPSTGLSVPPRQNCAGWTPTSQPPGRYPARCSVEFGLSSPVVGSDRPVQLPALSLYDDHVLLSFSGV